MKPTADSLSLLPSLSLSHRLSLSLFVCCLSAAAVCGGPSSMSQICKCVRGGGGGSDVATHRHHQAVVVVGRYTGRRKEGGVFEGMMFENGDLMLSAY
ncbi:hypothetical protein Hanom_Chr17g01585591 [Helianthus anomalus]